jgi:hypothetical protein
MADPAATPVPDGPAPGVSVPGSSVPGSSVPGSPASDRPASDRPAPRPAGARVTHRVALFVLVAAACGLAAWAGAWFVPFLAGLAAGALSARWRRGVVLPVAAGAVVGWVFPIWVLALSGQPVGATARAIAALAGIPPYAGVAVFAVLLLALLQAFCGAWLARGLLYRRSADRLAVFPPGGRPPGDPPAHGGLPPPMPPG